MTRRAVHRLAVAAAAVAIALVTCGAGRPGGGPSTGEAPDAGSCARSTRAHAGARPWHLARLDPGRVWPISIGAGQVVAVISTGVDAAHPQFARGQVLPGADVMSGRPAGRADSDCDGRGTLAAGLIAARPDSRTAVVGLAPGVRILPIRATQTVDQGGNEPPGPAALTAGIRYAVAQRATVICVTVAGPAPSAELEAAVTAANRAGVLVVSAGAPGLGRRPGPTYPTAYPGVIAVTGVDAEDRLLGGAETGAHLDLAAPGGDLWSTGAGGRGRLVHSRVASSPPLAAALVAGTVALVRAAPLQRPADRTPASIADRMRLTADQLSAGGVGSGFRWGVVNPYAAVTAVLPSTPVRPPSTHPSVDTRVEALHPPRPDAATRRRAVTVVVVMAVAATAVPAGFAVVRSGRRRRWRPGRVTIAEGPRPRR